MGKERMKGRRWAFTLMEMLVVMAIIVIVMGITVAAFAPFMKGRSLSSAASSVHSAASSVQSMVSQARAYAATNGSNAALFFHTGEGSITLYDGSQPVDKPVFLPRGVSCYKDGQAVPEPFSIVFSPMGSLDPISTAGSMENPKIVLRDDGTGKEKVIEVIFVSGLTTTYDR